MNNYKAHVSYSTTRPGFTACLEVVAITENPVTVAEHRTTCATGKEAQVLVDEANAILARGDPLPGKDWIILPRREPD